MIKYIPSCGDIVWIEFETQQGKEIQKVRPALVVSPQSYNQKTGLALFMPITSRIKHYPFEVVLPRLEVSGAILCDQIRSLDWNVGKAQFITVVSESVLEAALQKLMLLLNPSIGK